MLTKEDLVNIREVIKEEIKEEIKDQMVDMKSEISDLKAEVSDIKENMVTKKEFYGLKSEFNGLRSEFYGLKNEFNGLRSEFYGLKNEFDELRSEFDEFRDYSHQKFILIENEVIPQISALYESTDLYVKQMECRKRNDRVNEKLECIEPLKVIAKSHSDRLAKHDEMLEMLAAVEG